MEGPCGKDCSVRKVPAIKEIVPQSKNKELGFTNEENQLGSEPPSAFEPLDENLVQPTPRFQPCSMLNTEPGHNVLAFLPKELD